MAMPMKSIWSFEEILYFPASCNASRQTTQCFVDAPLSSLETKARQDCFDFFSGRGEQEEKMIFLLKHLYI